MSPNSLRAPPAAASAVSARNPAIDLLRGVSILLVVLHHIGLRIPLRKTAVGSLLPTWFLNGLNFNGYESVFVFFVISGFLIAGHTIERWGSLGRIDARAFYRRRLVRIVPGLLAIVALLSAAHLLRLPYYVIDRAEQSLPRAIGAVLGLHLNWYEGQTGYLPGGWDVLWSLSIEEVFYLAFPLVCLLAGRSARREVALGVALLALALSLPVTRSALAGNEIWQEKAYAPGVAAIATGVLGALIARRLPASRALAAALQVLGLAGLLAVFFVEGWLWKRLHDATMLVLTGSALCLLLAASLRRGHGPARPVPGLGWLRRWGRLSYEIYLTHMFVVFGLLGWWKSIGGSMAQGWLLYVPALPLCWLLGTMFASSVTGPAERRWGGQSFAALRERGMLRLARARDDTASPSA